MPRKIDNTAAKQRKQKIFVAVGGVLFLGIAAIQGPKMLKMMDGSTPPPAPAAATAPADASTTASDTPAAAGAPGASPTAAPAPSGAAIDAVKTVPAPASQKAQLAGVVVVPEQPVAAETGQLDSFSEFEVKDPFVPQIKAAEVTSTSSAATATKSASPAATSKPATPAGAAGAATKPGAGLTGPATPMAPAAPTAAILRVNGRLMALEPKDAFPKGDRMFVLVSLKKGFAKIGVAAGGKYTSGSKTLTLQVGKKVTLLNTATGIRYVIKLVYVGADSAQLTAFTIAAPETTQTKK
jgi:hypothetical protein